MLPRWQATFLNSVKEARRRSLCRFQIPSFAGLGLGDDFEKKEGSAEIKIKVGKNTLVMEWMPLAESGPYLVGVWFLATWLLGSIS